MTDSFTVSWKHSEIEDGENIRVDTEVELSTQAVAQIVGEFAMFTHKNLSEQGCREKVKGLADRVVIERRPY